MSTPNTPKPLGDAVDQLENDYDAFFESLNSSPAQKPASVPGGSGAGLVGTPIQARSLVTLKDGRTLKVQRVSKHGVLTLVHTCGGFAAYSHASAVVAV